MFHTEVLLGKTRHRTGAHASLQAAKHHADTIAASVTDLPVGPAAVYEGPFDTSIGGGELVSVRHEGAWIDVATTHRPDWWGRLGPATQRALLEQGRDPLTADLWLPVVQAGAKVSGAWWPSVAAGPDGLRLGLSDEAWLAVEAVRRLSTSPGADA